MKAAEVLENEERPSPLFLLCEHASNAIPRGFEIPPEEREWLETHWGWDLGAEEVVRGLSELEDAPAVLGGFCRLICDPNRQIDQAGLIRERVAGTELSFNRGLDEAEVERRLETFYHPYHRTVERRLRRAVEVNDELFLLSIHSFTPELDGQTREMELGVLFDETQEPYAREIADELRDEGFDTALNEPYSGKNNMIYSVSRHGREHDLRHVEIEVRNDLIRTDEQAREIAGGIARALRRLPWYGTGADAPN